MSTRGKDPVPAIAEDHAEGELAILYEAIRTATGVPVVNLVWRHIATIPGALDFSWARVGEMYTSGRIATEGQRLLQAMTVPDLPRLSEPSLANAGVNAATLPIIRSIVDSYDRSNAMNLVALTALAEQLDPEHAPAAELSVTANETVQVDSGRSITTDLPDALSPQDMSDDLQQLVYTLNAIGGDDGILATMYRHLAHWPGYLAMLEALLKPLEYRGDIRRCVNDAITSARVQARRLSLVPMDTGRELPKESLLCLQQSLGEFIHGPIGRMTVIARIVANTLPPHEKAV